MELENLKLDNQKLLNDFQTKTEVNKNFELNRLFKRVFLKKY